MPLTIEPFTCFVPDGESVFSGLMRTTHLAVGAHPDDVEILGVPGILAAQGSATEWFGGIVCTTGSGSPRGGEFSGVNDADMATIRWEEQRAAAELGRYSAIVGLGLESDVCRDQVHGRVSRTLTEIISIADPRVIFTHSPFDRHATHRAVVRALVAALRGLTDRRPEQVWAMEIWGSQDWLPAAASHRFDVSAAADLADDLLSCHKSQIEGGKSYDTAVAGRQRANATFHDPTHTDRTDRVMIALDLTPVCEPDGPTLDDYANGLIEEFRSDRLRDLRDE